MRILRLLIVGTWLMFIVSSFPAFSERLAVARVVYAAGSYSWREGDTKLLNGAHGEPALHALEQFATTKLGLHLFYNPTLRLTTGNLGETILEAHLTVIDAGLTPNDRLATLAHELGHVLAPPNLQYSEEETFVELVSFVVCRRAGVDTAESSAKYLAARRNGLRIASLYQSDIIWAADVLVPR